jgi:hypothetical protein
MSKNLSTLFQSRTHCVVCNNTNLESVISLPHFPLTGIFVDPKESNSYPTFDQELLTCPTCGHAQLKNAIDPNFLYKDTYTHRTSPSPIARAGNDFFHTFLRKVIQDRKFETVLEVGCNDHYLLQKLSDISKNRIGIDPILSADEFQHSSEIKSIGKFVEDIDWENECHSPDLILSVHTFEHVLEPRKVFEPLFANAKDGALFIIEVPGFDSLLNVNRFDQIFHQHVNYYSLASFTALIDQLGGSYLTHAFNFDYWNGTMLIAFEKKASRTNHSFQKITPELIQNGFKRFTKTLSQTKEQLDYLYSNGTKLYGFGAAQMVPCLAYHLNTDMNEFVCIYDDNLEKNGKTYPGLKTTISSTNDFSTIKEGAVLVTALDSARKIIPRLIQLQARYIFQPLPVL